MTNPKLSDEDYDAIVETLVERALLGARGTIRESIKKWVPKRKLVRSKWLGGSAGPINFSLTINIDQCIGDALIEWEKRKR